MPSYRSLAVAGALLGATAIAVPAVASAQDASTEETPTDWIASALDALVEDGTLDDAQAAAVADALRDARPERGFRGEGGPMMGRRGPGGPGGPEQLAAVAEALDLTLEELVAALRDGSTVAALAEDAGVELDSIVEILVDEAEAHLAERVESGEITQEQADERLAEMTERITAALEGDGPLLGGPGGRRGGHGHHGRGGPGPDDGGLDLTPRAEESSLPA